MNEWVSDYTPSIQDMRETYEETHFYAPHTNSVKEKNAEFDRFLELVYQVERERIIKLLMELKSENLLPEQAISKGWKFDEPAGIWWLPQDILIDLIKGETND